MADWNAIFKREGRVFSGVQEDFPSLVKLFRKERAERILDLGCGTGRHAVFLASKGFDVCAMDVSPEGLGQTRAWLKKRRLRAALKRASAYGRFPFRDSHFDAVVSTQVIQHARIGRIRKAISEIARVLKPEGLVFLTVPKMWGRSSGKLRKIAERTFIPLDGSEKGLVHYFFDRKALRKELSGRFSILDLHEERNHLCVLARKRE